MTYSNRRQFVVVAGNLEKNLPPSSYKHTTQTMTWAATLWVPQTHSNRQTGCALRWLREVASDSFSLGHSKYSTSGSSLLSSANAAPGPRAAIELVNTNRGLRSSRRHVCNNDLVPPRVRGRGNVCVLEALHELYRRGEQAR